MAHSAILAHGVHVESLPDQDAAWVQAALVRLDSDPGRIDGVIDDRMLGAIRAAGADPNDPALALHASASRRTLRVHRNGVSG